MSTVNLSLEVFLNILALISLIYIVIIKKKLYAIFQCKCIGLVLAKKYDIASTCIWQDFSNFGNDVRFQWSCKYSPLKLSFINDPE